MLKLSNQSLHKLSVTEQKSILVNLLAGVEPSPGFSWSHHTLLAQLQSDFGQALYVDGVPAALVIWRDLQGEAEIFSLMTAPAFKRRGLMSELLKRVFDANSQIRTWWLEVHEGNIEALNLYKKLGFEIHGRRPGYYPDGGAAVLFKRSR